MLNYITQNFMVIIVIIMSFTRRTFATWKLPPPKPHPNASMSCCEWIMFYKFYETDVIENRKLAKNRTKTYDLDVETFAAIYAQILTAFPAIDKLTPKFFCDNYLTNFEIISFFPLKGLKLSCEDWIGVYGYGLNTNESETELANSRSRKEDGHISLWAALYSRYLSKTSFIEVYQFCKDMGKRSQTIQDNMNFMTLEGTLMSCQEWILLSGYKNDTITSNIGRALYQNKSVENYMNYWTRQYVKHLRKNNVAKKYCCFIYKPEPLSPLDFCESNSSPDALLYDYYGTNV